MYDTQVPLMMTSLRQRIDRIATPRNTLAVFLCLLPFNLVFFPWRSKQLKAILGYPPRLFDTRLSYTPQEVHTLSESLGQAGRRLYAATEVTLDFAYPVLYTSLLSLVLALVWRKARPHWSGRTWLPLVPYIGMAGDLTENVSLASLMTLFPGEPAWLTRFSNLASRVKWSAGLISFGMIVVGLGITIIKRFNRNPEA